MKSITSFAVTALAAAILTFNVPGADAQTRIVNVEGRAMRVWSSGLDARRSGQPVLILEAGAGAGLETWQSVFDELARLGPVIAYDRRGIGKSEPDTEKPTVRRVNQSLHALLASIQAPPPYILVGHSWGGALMRGFGAQYPGEIAGYVYIEVPDIDATQQSRAAVLPPSERAAAFAPVTPPPIPPDTPPGLRAEMEVVGENYVNDWAGVRDFKQAPGVPVAVIIAAPAGRLKGAGAAMMGLQISHQAEWALTSSDPLIIVSGRVGHNVMKDDAALVLQAVRHVLRTTQ